ncbi:MAG: transposase [Firmicutes bacterium]|nr:transposase [Bacillota bacterium]
MNKTKPETAMRELTMILMYLSRFNDRNRFGPEMDRTWKGYDFEVIDELDKEGNIMQGSHRSKSVYITDKGMELARALMNKYNILDWEARD